MNQTLYSKRGAYRVTGSLSLGVPGNGGTWPLAKLTLFDDGLTFNFLRHHYDFKYSDIDHLEVKKTGFLYFIAEDPTKSFAFGGQGLDRAVRILQEKQVRIEQDELMKLSTARTVITVQFTFAILFLALMLLVVIGEKHIGPLSHLRFRN